MSAPVPPVTTTARVGGSRRADARRNHERIVRAARDVFGRKGLRGTIPEVAERAGVGKATVYRSYPSKDHLVAALVAERFRMVEDRLAAAMREPVPYDAMRRYIPDLFEALAEDRLLADALVHGGLVDSARLLTDLAGLIDTAKAGGRIRPDAGVTDVHVILCGAVRQLMNLDDTGVALWRRYGDLVFAAFAAPPAA